MPSRRTVRTVHTVEELPPIVTTTTTTRRSRKVLPEDEDGFSRETIIRRQDQKIKDDITNKLYRIEMDRVKPSLDVQLQTAHFRALARPRTRTITPEPILRVAPRATSVVDLRRYSTAGNLDIYRPKAQIRYGFERPATEQVVEYVSSNNALVPYGWKGHNVSPNNDLLSEYDLRRLAEIKVRGRGEVPNGIGRIRSSEVSYLPIVPRVREVSSPPALYHYSTEPIVSTRISHQPVPRSKRVASDGHYELDQFEKLMNRNFGTGGLNRNKTLLYSSPPYASAYEPYVSPYATYSTHSVRPYPYYSGSYSYSYPNYSRPYTYSSYVPYTYQRPSDYEYSIYSPPTRVTAPWGYSSYPRYYGDTSYYGGYYSPSKYYTYSY